MYGISPMDFYEMTCKDIGEFCMSRKKKEEIELKTQASIEYRNVTRILNFFSAKPKKITFEELFPEFDEEQKQREKFNTASNNTKETMIANVWREFLKK